MKKLLLFFTLFFLTTPVQAFNVPEASSYVLDTAEVLQNPESIEKRLTNLKDTTGYEFAVFITQNLEEEPIEYVSEQVFNTWGIGNEEYDNGILLVIAIEDKKFRIETGYGVEAIIPDLKAKLLLDILPPYFRESDFDGGINALLDEAIYVLENNIEYVDTGSEESFFFENLFSALMIFGIFFIWIGSILARTKSWWLGGVLGFLYGLFFTFGGNFSYFWILLFVILGFLFDYFISKNYKNTGKHNSWWAGGNWGPGGSNFGGGGSSFGGFGGGSSGGGGASGGW